MIQIDHWRSELALDQLHQQRTNSTVESVSLYIAANGIFRCNYQGDISVYLKFITHFKQEPDHFVACYTLPQCKRTQPCKHSHIIVFVGLVDARVVKNHTGCPPLASGCREAFHPYAALLVHQGGVRIEACQLPPVVCNSQQALLKHLFFHATTHC